jgi:hypothetical protein
MDRHYHCKRLSLTSCTSTGFSTIKNKNLKSLYSVCAIKTEGIFTSEVSPKEKEEKKDQVNVTSIYN